MTHLVVQEDTHKIQRRYENATQNLNENETIPEANKQKIREFLAEYGVSHELSTARKLFYLQKLTTIATILGATSFAGTWKEDLERVLSTLIDRRTEIRGAVEKPLAAWAIWSFNVAMKVFWRWMRGQSGTLADQPF